MKKLLVLTLTVVAVSLLSVSCKKRCDIPDSDVHSGNVTFVDATTKEIPIVYPTSGYMTSSMGGTSNYHINENHSYADEFEVSFDGGFTKAPVNYSQYNLLCHPVTVSCDATLERNVIIDDVNQLVTYTLTVHECNQGCDELRVLENYILVPDFPDTYNVLYNVIQ